MVVVAAAAAAAAPRSSCEPGEEGGGCWDAEGMMGMEPGPRAGWRWQTEAAEPMLAVCPCATSPTWPVASGGVSELGTSPERVGVSGADPF